LIQGFDQVPQLAAALADVLKQKGKNGTSIRSLNEYMDDLPWKLW
jgi:hypothetical protein